MFERIKKAFSKGTSADPAPSIQAAASSQLSEWAGTQGLGFSAKGDGKGFSLDGQVRGKPWRMESGKPSRDFIQGEELRGRAELGIREDAAILVMNRPLKDALEKRAYALYTDSLQTTADPNLPEEMRWLAMYEEVGWESAPSQFWDFYAVLADHKEDALDWITDALTRELLAWPLPDAQTPFILMILRGKAYLRMEYTQKDTPTLEHAVQVFTVACEQALTGIKPELAD